MQISLPLPAFLPSAFFHYFILLFLLPQKGGGGGRAPPLDPPLRSHESETFLKAFTPKRLGMCILPIRPQRVLGLTCLSIEGKRAHVNR